MRFRCILRHLAEKLGSELDLAVGDWLCDRKLKPVVSRKSGRPNCVIIVYNEHFYPARCLVSSFWSQRADRGELSTAR